MENFIGDPNDFMRSDPAYVDLEIDGKAASFVIPHDFNLNIDGTGNVCYGRFELARNPQAYAKIFAKVLSMKGQNSIIQKDQYDQQIAQRAKGLYKHLNC